MPFDRNRHHRQSIRLPGYDNASSGAYFVTICVQGGACLWGEVVDGEMQLSHWGQIAREEWLASDAIRQELKLDSFVVMPNHLHGIVWISATDAVDGRDDTSVGAHGRAPLQPAPLQPAPLQPAPLQPTPLRRAPRSLGSFVAGYKSAVTKRINQLRDRPGMPLWQRNYWEHIIRDEESLARIREYIENNPERWLEDQLHPDALPNPFNQWRS